MPTLTTTCLLPMGCLPGQDEWVEEGIMRHREERGGVEQKIRSGCNVN